MNIIINTSCNASCDFCFAKQKTLQLKKEEMSIDEFKSVLSFIEKSSFDQIKILGGEPTLHKDFKRFIRMSEKCKKKISIFTNGFVAKELTDFLKDKKIRYVVNFTARHFSKDDKNKLDYFLRTMGNKCKLGINYTDKFDMKEADEIVNTVEKYNLTREIRLGIASPIHDLSNNYLDFERDKKSLNENLVRLSDKLLDKSIKLYHDCSCIPVCSLSDSTLLTIKKNTNANIRFYCQPPLDILPGNLAIRCFGCSSIKLPLKNFKDLDELNYHFLCLDEFLKQKIKIGKCKKCKFEYKMCQGGCLATRFNLLKKIQKKLNYNFSENSLYLRTDYDVTIFDVNNVNKNLTCTGIFKEIFDLILQDVPVEDLIRIISIKYQKKKQEMGEKVNNLLFNLKEKDFIL